jgi:hypothetical protein
MHPAETILTGLLMQVREASLDQFMIFAKRSGTELEPIETKRLPFVQHMTHILISGAELEVNFKTHFMLLDAIRLTKGKLAASEASTQQAIDFMKEYCNRIAGKTKAMLEATGLTMGQSLPFAIQGYNEIFYARDASWTSHAAWRLKDPQGEFCCSVAVILRTDDVLEPLKRVAYERENPDQIGAVELF